MDWIDTQGKVLLNDYLEAHPRQRSFVLEEEREQWNNQDGAQLFPWRASLQGITQGDTAGSLQWQSGADLSVTILEPRARYGPELLDMGLKRIALSSDRFRIDECYAVLVLSLEYQRHSQRLMLLEESYQNLEEQLAAMESLASRGRITRAELDSAKARLARRRALLEAQRSLEQSYYLEIQSRFLENTETWLSSIHWDSLEQSNSEEHELLRLDRQIILQSIALLELEVQSVANPWVPSLNLSAGIDFDAQGLEWQGGLYLSISSRGFLSHSREIEGLELQILELENELNRQDIHWQRLMDQNRSNLRFSAEILQWTLQAEAFSLESLNVVKQEFASGLTTSQDLLSAMANHRTLSEESINALWDYRRALLDHLYFQELLEWQ